MGGCKSFWVGTTVIFTIIGLLCMTAGYVANKNYNAQYWETTCTYTSYNFQAFPWNNWDCKHCTAYYAAVMTQTADNLTWFEYQVIVYPTSNSVARQTAYYAQHWPIGQTVTCWQTGCCSSAPIFELADVYYTFWFGVAFLATAGLILVILILLAIIRYNKRIQYSALDDSKSGVV